MSMRRDEEYVGFGEGGCGGEEKERNTEAEVDGQQCLIQDKISTSPSPTDRRAVVTPSPRVAHGRHIGRYFYLIILPLLIILLSLKSNFIIL